MKDPEDTATVDLLEAELEKLPEEVLALTHQPDEEIALGLDEPPPETPDVIPLYIFDLDGTIANIEHRRHLVEKREGGPQPDWDEFYRRCVDDWANWPVISTLVALLDRGCDVWIWSGRSSMVMNETREWLRLRISHERAIEIDLQMRDEGDFTPDDALKERWLGEMSDLDRRRLVAVFDDRDKVVAMWRRNGVACFQVAPGDF